MADTAVWAVTFDERVIQVRDLPVGKLAKIAKDTDHSLIEVVGGPFIGDGTQLEPILRLAAEWVGPEASVPNPLSFHDAQSFFSLVPDDLPEPEKAPSDPPTGAAT